ncbi:MAG: type 4a pilus biogenesis protein PilO [Candidatus Omnitrophica bacterium]|nr:type 4a pilus biogenesis protein PilO [Candidatus Omnitrophota bacterium]
MDAKLQLSTLQKDVARIKEKSARIDSMRSELERLAAQYDVAITATLPEEQLPEVLDAIAAAARVSGVRLIGIKPKEEVSHLTPSASGFLELPIQVDALGGYHHLGRFLSAVEESKVLVGVQELTIQANPEDIWNHKALFVFVAYLFPAREGAKS